MSNKKDTTKDTSDTETSTKHLSNTSEMHPLLRITLIFSLVILSVIILFYGQPLLLPLTIAGILSMMLNPLMNRMLRIGFPKWLTITLLTLLLIVIGGAVVFLFERQISVISKDWPDIQKKIISRFNETEQYIQETFNIMPDKQESSALGAIPFKDFFLSFIGSSSKILSDTFLVLIYIILMLSARDHFKRLIIKLSPKKRKLNSEKAIDNCIKICSKFLVGRLIIVAIIIVLYAIGFWAGGIPYGLFLALIAGFLSIIPFLGNIIGGFIACVLAFVMGGIISLLVVLGVIIIGQLIGDYILTPWIIGDAVRLNPFITIFSVMAFIILWGPVGAIFALPLVAMLRVILENKPATEPYADFLAGKR